MCGRGPWEFFFGIIACYLPMNYLNLIVLPKRLFQTVAIYSHDRRSIALYLWWSIDIYRVQYFFSIDVGWNIENIYLQYCIFLLYNLCVRTFWNAICSVDWSAESLFLPLSTSSASRDVLDTPNNNDYDLKQIPVTVWCRFCHPSCHLQWYSTHGYLPSQCLQLLSMSLLLSCLPFLFVTLSSISPPSFLCRINNPYLEDISISSQTTI